MCRVSHASFCLLHTLAQVKQIQGNSRVNVGKPLLLVWNSQRTSTTAGLANQMKTPMACEICIKQTSLQLNCCFFFCCCCYYYHLQSHTGSAKTVTQHWKRQNQCKVHIVSQKHEILAKDSWNFIQTLPLFQNSANILTKQTFEYPGLSSN